MFETANGEFEREIPREVLFDIENCRADLGKGQHFEPRQGELVLDTGDFELSGEGNPYEETIDAGVIDHHRIDNLYRIKGQDFEPKCATKIVADYTDRILKVIEDRGVTKTLTHSDGDLDSITSSYLVQSLIQRKELPTNVQELAEHINKVDYGRYRENNTDKLFQSLAGNFLALKKGLDLDKELDNKKFDQELTRIVFKVLNESEKESLKNDDFDYEKDILSAISNLPLKDQEIIKKGKELTREEIETFNQDFEKAEKINIKVKVPKSEKSIEVPLIISLDSKLSPLTFINLAYQRISPETIIAAYGTNKKEGDSYNIGIMSESASLIDLGDLCVALNRKEKEKREELSADSQLLKDLESQPDRLNMSGLEQVLTKDPTVMVGGGSLIAASRSSLLSKEDFYQVLKEHSS